jgi:hypothetical protein
MENVNLAATWGYPPAVDMGAVKGGYNVFSQFKGAFVDELVTVYNIHFNNVNPNAIYFISLQDCHSLYIYFMDSELKFRIFNIYQNDEIYIMSEDYQIFEPFITAFIRKKKLALLLK